VVLRHATFKLAPPKGPVNAPYTGLETARTLPQIYVNVRYIGTGPTHNGLDVPNPCTIMVNKAKLFLIVVVADT
jgi:hypothetical protein